MSRQCVLEELSAGSALFFAGSRYSIPLSPYQRTTPQTYPPVNNTMSNPLLSDIIDPRRQSIFNNQLQRIFDIGYVAQYVQIPMSFLYFFKEMLR